MKLLSEWHDRIVHWTHALTQDFYEPLGRVEFSGFTTFEKLTIEQALAQNFSPMPIGSKWGREWQYAWLKASVILPEEANEKMIVLDLKPGGEATIFVNGEEFGTKRAEWVTIPHHYLQDNFLCEKGIPGTKFDLLLEAYAGHFYPESVFGEVGVGPVFPNAYQDPFANAPRAEIGNSTFGIWNEEAYQLWLDVLTLTDIMKNLSDGSLRAAKIARGLMDFTLNVDFEQNPELRQKDYKKARKLLRPLLDAKNGTTVPVFYGIGNSHLDMAWLWPLEETIRKTARTFAQQLRLIQKYPDYVYLQSQPQCYQMCKEHYPALYKKIKQAVSDGRWIAEGAMWVEPDTNMVSGESLIRQLMIGMQFFRDEFDIECEILWLPDTFGYSAALPQILKGFGIKYLVTQKIFWSYNESEVFPYHYFKWQGNDGSEVVSFLPTSYTYKTNPDELINLWENRRQKDEMDKFLLPFGYGDGGGGPTRDYIEFAIRQNNLEGAPKLKMTHPKKLFEDLAADGGPVHKYTGELYFTAHRGVYTSQALVKSGNRRSEFLLRESEMWAAIAALQTNAAYPKKILTEQWKTVLLNQFHDILPGSSIGKVYDKAAEAYKTVAGKCAEIIKTSSSLLAEESDNFTIFNSVSWARQSIVEIPNTFANGAQTAEGSPMETIIFEDKVFKDKVFKDKVFAKVNLPSCGYLVLKPALTMTPFTDGASVFYDGDNIVLENSTLKSVFNKNGEIISFILKKTSKEFAKEAMNKFRLFKDVPRKFDAWDIDSPYELQEIYDSKSCKIALINSAHKSAISIKKVIGNSLVEQIISLEANSTRIEFDTSVDWKELHRLLKVTFPINIHATEAINEIQFGYIKRPTHRSRQYEKDRFEVCNHKYTALCDEGHGAAILNDCKYGVSMLDSSISLTLLKAAAAPQMRADNHKHKFKYAFTAWEGSFIASDVVRQGYELNLPLTTINGGIASKSFFSIDKSNIIIDTIKLAEDDSGDLIVRVYEAQNAGTTAAIICAIPILSASLCALNEEILGPIEIHNNKFSISLEPFQICTLRLKKHVRSF